LYKFAKRRSNPPIKRKGSQGFPEGLNTLAHPSMLKDSELSELINGIYSQYGTISKRQGSKVVGTAAADATKIIQLTPTYNIVGASRLIRISDNGKPEYRTNEEDDWKELSGTAPPGYSGSDPAFVSGVPVFDTTTTTWIVQANGRIYFANAVDRLVWLDDDGWHVYTALNNPTTKPTVAKTGSATGSTKYYYQYVWHNEGGYTKASPAPKSSTDASGTGWIGDMPMVLDSDTYLTITLPTAPPGTTKTSIYRSVGREGVAFYLDTIDAAETTYTDKGDIGDSTYYGVPDQNTTSGYHFKLLDVYRGSLVGVTTELGDETLVWSGFAEKGQDLVEGGTGSSGSFALSDGAGFFPYRKGEGTSINAIKTHVASNEDALFVFKDNCFGKFQYTPDDSGGTIRDVNISVGSLSALSPHTAGNNLRFWSQDGAATVGNEANYGTILRYSVLSLRANAITQRITAANLPNVCGVFYKSLSLFGISTDISGGSNNAVLAYDERYNAWSLWTGLYPQVFAKYIDPVDKIERLFYGSGHTADVLQMFEGKTDYATSTGSGTKVTLSLSTKQYDMGLPDQFKKFDRATLVFGTLTGNSTTVGVVRADHKGIHSDDRLRVAQEATLSGFGNDEWGAQEVGTMTEGEEGLDVNLRYINLRQKDLFWVKINIQNDGVEDEIDVIGIYLYYSESKRSLTFDMKLTELAAES